MTSDRHCVRVLHGIREFFMGKSLLTPGCDRIHVFHRVDNPNPRFRLKPVTLTTSYSRLFLV